MLKVMVIGIGMNVDKIIVSFLPRLSNFSSIILSKSMQQFVSFASLYTAEKKHVRSRFNMKKFFFLLVDRERNEMREAIFLDT